MLAKVTQSLFSLGILILLASLVGCSSTPIKKNQYSREASTLALNTGRYGHAVVNNGSHIFVIGGAGSRGLLSNIEIITPQTGAIEEVNNTLIPRRYHTAVWDGKNSIYIMGGMSPVTNKNTRMFKREPRIEVFDIPTRQTKIIGKMPEPRRFGSAQYYDGQIFFIGGSFKKSVTSTVSIYDIKQDKWKLAANMPQAKETKTIQNGQYLYTVGGYDGKSSVTAFERYDITSGEWQSLASLPQKVSANSVVVFDDKIFSFGDYTELDSSMIYDFKTETWKQTNIGYLSSRHNAATALNNKMYVIGGNIDGSGSHLNTIQVFGL
jgi:hypothetical protein